MAATTEISWTDATFNPWLGCTKVAAGCTHCYAEALMDTRYGKVEWGANGTRVLTSPSYWKQPLKWNREAAKAGERRRVFCASLADVFEEWTGPILNSKGERLCFYEPKCGYLSQAPYIEKPPVGARFATQDDIRRDLFALIDATPNLDWLILTKRPENVRRMWPAVDQHASEYPPAPSEEVVQPIEGYPNYFVSNFGLVYSSNGSHCCLFCGKQIEGGVANRKYCDQRCNDNAYKARRRGKASQVEQTMRQVAADVGEQGHCRVTLYRDGESRRELVHRLVLTAFVRPPEGDEQGCHRDRNPKNNRIDNLRWGTQSGNWDDSIHHGTHRRSNKLTEQQVVEIRSRLAVGESYAALGRSYSVSATQIGNIDKNQQWCEPTGFRRNCWIGCSIATQADADKNIPELLKCRDLSPVLFVSAEPLIEEITLMDLQRIKQPKLDWLIIGGESGPRARPCDVAWIRSLKEQCAAAGVPCFVKQLGANRYDTLPTEPYPLKDAKGGDWSEWCSNLRVRDFPKVTA